MIPLLIVLAAAVIATAIAGPWRAFKLGFCWLAAKSMSMADWCGLMEEAKWERQRRFRQYHRDARAEVFEK